VADQDALAREWLLSGHLCFAQCVEAMGEAVSVRLPAPMERAYSRVGPLRGQSFSSFLNRPMNCRIGTMLKSRLLPGCLRPPSRSGRHRKPGRRIPDPYPGIGRPAIDERKRSRLLIIT
jgi:hypothetical protein